MPQKVNPREFGGIVAKILFLAHRVPFPPNKGDKIRAFHELMHLAEHHEIWLGAPADDPADLEHLKDAKAKFHGAYFGSVGLWQTGVNLAGALLDGTPLSVRRFRHPGLMRWCKPRCCAPCRARSGVDASSRRPQPRNLCRAVWVKRRS